MLQVVTSSSTKAPASIVKIASAFNEPILTIDNIYSALTDKHAKLL